MLDQSLTIDERMLAEEARRSALLRLLEAWEDALIDGIDGDCIAQAALFAAFRELVATYGEEAVAGFASRLPERVRAGEFTHGSRAH